MKRESWSDPVITALPGWGRSCAPKDEIVKMDSVNGAKLSLVEGGGILGSEPASGLQRNEEKFRLGCSKKRKRLVV